MRDTLEENTTEGRNDSIRDSEIPENLDLDVVFDETKKRFYLMREVVGLIAKLADGRENDCLTNRSIGEIRHQIEEIMSELSF